MLYRETVTVIKWAWIKVKILSDIVSRMCIDLFVVNNIVPREMMS